MRRHLNTIYVTSEDAYVRKDGANLVVEVDGAERGRAPIHMIGGLVCFGRAGASPAVFAACAEAGVAISLLTPEGRFVARVEGPRSGNVLLRRTQYRRARPQISAPCCGAPCAITGRRCRRVLGTPSTRRKPA